MGYHRAVLIPLGTDRGSRRPALITPALIVANLLIHLAMDIILRTDPGLWERIVAWGDVGGHDPRWWGLVTSLFLHGDWLHVGGNMLFLWAFGVPVEDRFGKPGFLALFLCGGVFAGFTHAALDPNPAIGASGAVSAITGAFLVLFPRTSIRCFWIFTLSVIAVPAWWFIGLAIAWDLLSQSMGAGGNVAHLAHLGGYVFGFSVSMTLLWARVFPREPYDLLTIFRQAKRRRELKSAAAAASVSRPEVAKARSAKQNAQTDALAAARAEVSGLVSAGDLDAAAEAYQRLGEKFSKTPAAMTLPRNAQYEVANQLVRMERREEAARAYELFLEAYPTDREADSVRLMHGRLLGRYLGERGRAVEQLERVLAEVHDQELKDMAREELAALRAEEDRA